MAVTHLMIGSSILFVHGDRLWGSRNTGTEMVGDHLSKGTEFVGGQFYGDRLSRGTGSRGPEIRGSNGFGTKCVAALLTYIENHIIS